MLISAMRQPFPVKPYYKSFAHMSVKPRTQVLAVLDKHLASIRGDTIISRMIASFLDLSNVRGQQVEHVTNLLVNLLASTDDEPVTVFPFKTDATEPITRKSDMSLLWILISGTSLRFKEQTPGALTQDHLSYHGPWMYHPRYNAAVKLADSIPNCYEMIDCESTMFEASSRIVNMIFDNNRCESCHNYMLPTEGWLFGQRVAGRTMCDRCVRVVSKEECKRCFMRSGVVVDGFHKACLMGSG